MPIDRNLACKRPDGHVWHYALEALEHRMCGAGNSPDGTKRN